MDFKKKKIGRYSFMIFWSAKLQVAQAVGLAKQLKDFAQYYGHEELSFTLSKVNSILHEMTLRAPKYHKTITADFFLLEIHIVTLKAFPTIQGKLDESIQCTSLKVHHGHFMDIFIVFNAFLFKIVVNKCKSSDFPLKKRVH